LVVPRRHVRDIWSLDPKLGAKLMDIILKTSRALRLALNPDGLNVINSAGEAASQTIYHLHIHLVPRWKNDHIGNIWPPSEPWREDALDEIAGRVRAACTGIDS
jgi:histidine triad (HIT) family protein